jgi:HTH-type transcriptional regulator / antitoxin HigA
MRRENMNARIPAEVFPPGEFLKDELEARSWTQKEFAEIIGKDPRLVYEVINGKRSITPETAIIFGEAFGTSPDLWMNLESQFQLSKVRIKQGAVARKAELHSVYPVREMVKRGWIEGSKNVEVLEQQVLGFFGIKDLAEKPAFQHAAKKTSYSESSMLQIAWLCRARKIAAAAPAQKYASSNLSTVLEELKAQVEFVDGIKFVAAILAKGGIRLVVVEALPRSKIDGACFWLDSKSPVIVVSLRQDRVDNFWHTIFHELDHVKHNEGMEEPVVDVDILGADADEMPPMEKRANEAAAESTIAKAEMTGFIARVSPLFSDEQIVGFARRLHIHPGIVVGQLQHRRLIDWSFHRKHLEKIRELVIATALTDGFGHRLNNL